MKLNSQTKMRIFLQTSIGFFVAMCLLNTSPTFAATATIEVKVLGIYENGPVVGGTATNLANGTQVKVEVLNTSEEVVGSAYIPVMNDIIGPQMVQSELLAGLTYRVHSEAINQIQVPLAVSEDDLFRSLGVTNVTFHNITPTSAQISITSFGGDEGQDFGLLPIGEPGRSARLRYKPFIPGIFGELLYEFLPENYIDFPLGEGPSPGQSIQQVLFSLTPNTTYSYKVVLSPLDEDENGLNDNYQTFVFPVPQPTDFIYSEVDGPLLWGGNGAMPTFTTPNISGGGLNGGGLNGGGLNGGNGTNGNDGGLNGGNGTNGQNGNTGGNQLPGGLLPMVTITALTATNNSATINGTVEGIPLSYTTSMYVSLFGTLINNGTPLSTGPSSFTVTVSGLEPNTTYQYHLASFPSDPMSTQPPVIFHSATFHFSTTSTNNSPVNVVVDGGGSSGTTTTSGDVVLSGTDVTINPDALVPCNGTTVPCTFQKLVDMVNRIIDFVLFKLALPLAAIIFAYAGVLYITSAASPNNKETAKKIFGTVFIGLIIALAAWLIVNTILTSFGINGSSAYSWLGQVGN